MEWNERDECGSGGDCGYETTVTTPTDRESES